MSLPVETNTSKQVANIMNSHSFPSFSSLLLFHHFLLSPYFFWVHYDEFSKKDSILLFVPFSEPNLSRFTLPMVLYCAVCKEH